MINVHKSSPEIEPGGFFLCVGLLHVGDKIKEVNGKDMGGNAEELQKALVSGICDIIATPTLHTV